MQNRLLTVALSAAFASGCGGSITKDRAAVLGDVKSNGGHLANAAGNIIKSGSGGCIRSGQWKEADLINICEGIEEKTAATTPAVEKKPEPVVEATSEPETVVAEPDSEPVIETVVLNSRALFGTNAFELSDKGNQAMRNLVSKLGEYTEIEKIEIVGYTDSTGTEQYNQVLSEKRASTIKGFLIAPYGDADIQSIGMGETEPTANNKTAEGRQQNRRVEIRVTAKLMKSA